MRRTGARGIEETSVLARLQNNIIVVATGIAIAAGGTVFGVASYFQTKEINHISGIHKLEVQELSNKHAESVREIKRKFSNEIETLTSRVSSIDRRLGDQKYLDVQKLFSAQPVRDRAEELIYISGAEFFALNDKDIWQFEVTDEAKLLKETSGLDITKMVDPRIFERAPLYLWRGTEQHEVQRADPWKRIFPYISVQVFPFDLLPAIAKAVTSDFKEEETVIVHDEKKGSEDEVKLTKFFKTSMQSDAVGLFLTSQLMGAYSAAANNQNITFSIRNLQKVGPVLYAQVVLKFANIVSNGKGVEKMFLVREYFVISRETNMVIVQTNCLSYTPSFNGEYF